MVDQIPLNEDGDPILEVVEWMQVHLPLSVFCIRDFELAPKISG